jgi:tRNA (guanine-N7-)-methyltransferase
MDARSFEARSMTDAPHNQTSFYGRRKGHPLRSHQAGLMDNLLPHLSVPLDDASDPAALFGGDKNEFRLEIGFGGGEHLAAEATAYPQTGFIGCEPYVNGMAKALALIEAGNIANIRLFAGDAAELLAKLPDASLSRADLIHPDPWPKRRHWKRRFVQDATLTELARVIVPGGTFRFVTDIDDYAGWTLAHVAQAPQFRWRAECADDWRKPWPGYTMTRYGRKAEREGRRAVYLVFERV